MFYAPPLTLREKYAPPEHIIFLDAKQMIDAESDRKQRAGLVPPNGFLGLSLNDRTIAYSISSGG